MKTLFILAVIAAALTTVSAQEKIPHDQMRKIVPKLLERLEALNDMQFKIAADRDKGDGIKASEVGLVVVPDKNLTAEKLEKAGKDIVPIGHLFLKGIAPAKNGKPTENDRMHILMIEDDGKAHRVWLCLLGAQKREGRLELVVYGSEKAPLLQVALRQQDSSQDVPIELSGEKQDDETGKLTLSVLGKYKASLVLMKQEG